jgi:choline dehydrogenase
MKLAVELVEKSKVFQSIGAQLSLVPLPACRTLTFRSDAYWECYLRHLTLTLYHPSGTCAMGKKHDPNAVLDSEMNVIGVKNLRVVDASVAPIIISSNINAACNVIAEVAAHLIKNTWKK